MGAPALAGGLLPALGEGLDQSEALTVAAPHVLCGGKACSQFLRGACVCAGPWPVAVSTFKILDHVATTWATRHNTHTSLQRLVAGPGCGSCEGGRTGVLTLPPGTGDLTQPCSSPGCGALLLGLSRASSQVVLRSKWDACV